MRFFLIFILILSNFASAVINPKKKITVGPAMSIDLGINGSCFDAQRRKICEDTGLVKGGYNPKTPCTYKIDGESYKHPKFVNNSPSFFEHDCNDYDGECTKRTKYTRGALASMHAGIFFDMNKYFAIGAETAAEWYRVKIAYNQDIYLCTDDECNARETPHWADATLGTLGPCGSCNGDYLNFQSLSCKDRFQTDRYYLVNPDDYAKYYNKFQYSLMLALKFYLNTSAYFKIAAGISIAHWKMPVYNGTAPSEVDPDKLIHTYKRKNVFLKRGLACAAEFGFFVTNNIAVYLRYGLTTNRTKNKIFNYITQNVGLGAQWTFGR